jgi:UDP-N-acetylmuramoylalanine--D-glutamate ligase
MTRKVPELDGARVLILGLGRSGQSAATFCAEQGATVVAADERTLDEQPSLSPDIVISSGVPFPDPADFDVVVPSPGVPQERYAERARTVWGDIELAGRALPVPVVAVTGTNGKSTTVCLIEAMLRSAGFRATAAGNLGTPALELLGQPLDVAVLEVSSFQLESVDEFRPRVAVVLNVTDDHIDRHGSLEAYAEAKGRLFARQGDGDVAIGPAEAGRARCLAEASRGRTRLFTLRGPVPDGAWWEPGAIALAQDGRVLRFPIDSVVSEALPPLENVLAALLAAVSIGAEPAKALRGLADFRGLPHRLERVADRNGVTWIDDSKATNPSAAARALTSQQSPVIWIAGGHDKALPFGPALAAAEGRVRLALLIGSAGPQLLRTLEGHIPCEVVGTLRHAVRRAAEVAELGDVVLLAPACASFDQFRSFEERGDRFRAEIETLGDDEVSCPSEEEAT